MINLLLSDSSHLLNQTSYNILYLSIMQFKQFALKHFFIYIRHVI
jgi:hypothetical protein